MIDLTAILQAVIGVIAVLITVYVIPWLRSKLTAEQQAELAEWVSIAVAAAEQLYSGSGRGDEKKAYVRSFLEAKGYTVDTGSLTDSIDALIEAAVYALNSGQLLVGESVLDSVDEAGGTATNLSGYTVSELKAMAKEAGLTGYSNMTKAELIALLAGGASA